jgi:hypothetical protein
MRVCVAMPYKTGMRRHGIQSDMRWTKVTFRLRDEPKMRTTLAEGEPERAERETSLV